MATDDDVWIDVDVDAEDASPPVVAAILESVARSLHRAPDDRRYDAVLEVFERGD